MTRVPENRQAMPFTSCVTAGTHCFDSCALRIPNRERKGSFFLFLLDYKKDCDQLSSGFPEAKI